MKAIRNSIIFALIFAVIFTAAPIISASAAEGYSYTDGDFAYNLDGDNAVVYSYLGNSTTVTIPDKLGGHTVTKVHAGFIMYSDVKPEEITFPNGVTFIPCFYAGTNNNMVDGWDCIKKLTFGNKVTELQEFAFSNYTNLETVVFTSNTLKTLGQYSFYGCKSLKNVLIPNTTEGFNLPTSLESIGDQAFGNDHMIKEVTLPDSVSYVGGWAFSSCGAYELKIGKGLKEIGDHAFSFMRYVLSVNIPSTVKSIGELAFYGCSNLYSVSFSEGLQSIGDYAFAYCGIGKVTLPKSLKTIESTAFNNNPLIEINVQRGNKYLTSVDGILLNADYSILRIYPPKKADLEYTAPSGVKTIKAGAFSNCEYLQKVNLPATVTKIEQDAFYNDATLKEVNVDEACTKFMSDDGILYNKEQTELIYYPSASSYVIYNVPNTVTKICDYAFYKSKLPKIILSNRLTEIGAYAFAVSHLQSITLPSSVKSIGEYAFSHCGKLETANLNEGLETLGDSCFYDAGITSITIPSTVDVIPKDCFWGAPNLTSVTISEGVKIIKQDAFEYTPITQVVFPSTLQDIERDAFNGCTKITSFVNYSHQIFLEQMADACLNLNKKKETLNDNITVVGYEHSQTRKYAEAYNMRFISMGLAYSKGDLNLDEYVDILDVTLLQRNLVGYEKFNLMKQQNADINYDGKVDIEDVTFIQRCLARMENGPWRNDYT